MSSVIWQYSVRMIVFVRFLGVMIPRYLIFAFVILVLNCNECFCQFSNIFGLPPNYRVDDRFERIVDTQYGPVRGFAVPYEKWYDTRYIKKDQAERVINEMNCFLGIPYAKPPIGALRFRDPLAPEPWVKDDPFNKLGRYNASLYRPICPQDPTWVKQTFKGYMNYMNISEDCLYLNIFVPNMTIYKNQPNFLYPIIVYIHGGQNGDFGSGAAQQWPGFVLAQYGVMVITVNYRLGPLGFLTTENSYAVGNYGFKDVVRSLEWIQENIQQFRGDNSKVTVMGHDSGASLIGFLLVSPLTRGRNLFKKAILMSGADTAIWSYVSEEFRPHEYASELGYRLGCPYYRQSELMECLRFARKDLDIANAGLGVSKKWGAWSGPWAVTVHQQSDVLDDLPANYRASGMRKELPILCGMTRTEGAQYLSNYSAEITGIDVTTETFTKVVYNEFVSKTRTYHYNFKQLLNSIQFEYTYWSNPENKTAQLENLIHVFTDFYYGTGMDALLKSQSNGQTPASRQVYNYVFDYRSKFSPLPPWMGVPHGGELPYVFGFPMMNRTIADLFFLDLSAYTWENPKDANFSDYIMTAWVNFATNDQSTPILLLNQQPWPTWNFTWYPYNLSRVASAWLMEWPHHVYQYKTNHYGFWNAYFPQLVEWIPFVTTTYAIPLALYQYQAATGVLAAFLFLAVIAIGILIIAVFRFRKRQRQREAEEQQGYYVMQGMK